MLHGKAEDLPASPPKVKGQSDIIRHYFRQRMRDRLAELGETKDRATISRLIAHAHTLGADKSAPLFEIVRHGYEITENMAHKLRQHGIAESIQMNSEDEDSVGILSPCYVLEMKVLS